MSARRAAGSAYPGRPAEGWGLSSISARFIFIDAVPDIRRPNSATAASYSSCHFGSRNALTRSWVMATWESAEIRRDGGTGAPGFDVAGAEATSAPRTLGHYPR